MPQTINLRNSSVSYPLNMSVGNKLKTRIGGSWKLFEVQTDITSNKEVAKGQFVYPKQYAISGNVKPFFNKQTRRYNNTSVKTLGYIGTGEPYADYSKNGDGNAFKPRPMKHYRLQYGNTGNKQTYYNKKYLIDKINRPGGTSIETTDIMDGTKIIDNLANHGKYLCNDNKCTTIVGIPDNKLGKVEKVGRYNPIYFDKNVPDYWNDTDSSNYEDGLRIDNYYPTSKQMCLQCPIYLCEAGSNNCKTIKKCVNICEPESRARNRVRYPSKFSKKELCENPYYVSSQDYMRARCRLFSQNSFHYTQGTTISQSTAPCECGDANCTNCLGTMAYNSATFRNNCPEVASKATCNNEELVGAYGKSCSNVYYKPNNSQFAQQGAVSGSSRLLRLKLNTINANANSIGHSYGSHAANALAYSGRPDAPFVNKQKMNAGGYSTKCQGKNLKYPCDTNLYHLYKPGGGNPTTSALNNNNNNRVISHFCKTSIYPTNSTWNFMKYSSKNVRLNGVGNRTLDGNSKIKK